MATMRSGGGVGGASEQEFLQALYTGGELLTSGKVIEAKDHLERAYQLQPKNEKGQNLLGLAYFKLGLFDRAAEIYEALIKENPVDPTLRVNLGLVYLKTSALQRAVREFEIATDLAPEHKKAQNYLGLALAQAGEYGRAKDAFVAAGSEPMAEKMARILSGEETPPAKEAESAKAKKNGHSHAEDGALAEKDWGSSAEVAGEHGKQEEIRITEDEGSRSGPPVQEEAFMVVGETADLADSDNVLIGAEEVPADPPPAAPPAGKVVAQGAREPRAEETPAARVSSFAKPVPVRPVAPPEAAAPPFNPGVPRTAPAFRPTLSISQVTQSARLMPEPMPMPFHVAQDVLTVTVTESMRMRLLGLIAASGALELGPEMKRFRGRPTDKTFGSAETQLMRVSGKGVLVLHAGKHEWLPLELGEEVAAYFREEVVFAFEEAVMFENGRVPSEISPDLDLVHLRGAGQVLLCLPGVVRTLEVRMDTPVTVPMNRLVGWQGSLTPRIVPLVSAPSVGVSASGVQLTGEGMVFVATPVPVST
jgi:Tfp pilus assembly protein PilF/uncharacterized protein (AIM24 family)